MVERALRQAALWDEVKDRLQRQRDGAVGGQQQRLCIARTIAPSPDVILLDEPTASLDPQGTQRIEELLFELKRDFTIIIVTHNMQQAARVSDTTTFFYLGSMVETGPTRQIFTAPRQEQTEAYITGKVRMSTTMQPETRDVQRAPRDDAYAPRRSDAAARSAASPAIDVRDFDFFVRPAPGAERPELRDPAAGRSRRSSGRPAAASPPSSAPSTG